MRISGRADVGRVGEEAALAHYRARGFRIVARNWRCSLGELDIVAERGGTLVFCEVKSSREPSRDVAGGCGSPAEGTRGSPLVGPFEAVHARKQRKLRALAEAFLPLVGQAPLEVRFDVASVTVAPGGRTVVHLFEDAF